MSEAPIDEIEAALLGQPDPSECRFCRWFVAPYRMSGTDFPGPERVHQRSGECHRHAPDTEESSSHRSRETKWPSVGGRMFCGDFERFRNADGTPNTDSHPPGA